MTFIDQPTFSVELLNNLGILRVHGSDAKKMLQGQLTCDLEKVSESQSTLGAHCNPQGRIISLFRLLSYEDNYLLQMPKPLIPIAKVALQKYAVFYKNLILTDMTDHFKQLGFLGGSADHNNFSPLPLTRHHTISQDGLIAIKISESPARYEIWYDLTKDIKNFPFIPPKSDLQDNWTHLNILDGIPQIYPETSEKFLPHELNLPMLGAVSFKKGCFTGQEIIARMEYKGKMKKKLIPIEVSSTINPTRGGDVFAKGKPCGQVVDYTQLSYNKFQLLVVISEDISSEGLSLE